MKKTVTTDELESKYAKKFNQGYAYQFLKFIRKKTRTSPKLIAGAMGTIVNVLGHFLSALQNPDTPIVMKAKIMGAIAYIVSPVDLIPDAIPILGFTDDLAAAKLLFDAVQGYSTFRLQDLDDEIDGIVTVRHEDYAEDDGQPEEAQAEQAVALLEAPPAEDAGKTAYDSTDVPIDKLRQDIERGNELFQKFLDRNAELDNDFAATQKKSKQASDDMWAAINNI